MFAYQASQGRVDVAFTDRHGGVSGGPYASLNLAGHTDDDPAAVQENIDRAALAFAAAAGTGRSEAPQVALMRQVHGPTVRVVGSSTRGESAPVADGLVTTEPGLVLMVRVADCVPVLLADASRGVVAAAHAGRPGVVAGIVPATLAAMREAGAREVMAWVGPHVCGACYEVPETMRSQVAAVVPEAFAETSWGTPSVDVGAAVTAQLRRDDVRVVDTGGCTREDENLFSYRRQGPASGRFAGLVWVRP